MKYAYFPGCAADATTKEAEISTRNVCKKLGIELIRNKGFSCCGAGVLSEENFELELTVNARNFALAEKDGMDIFTICNTCLLTMLKAKKILDEDDKWYKTVNENLAKVGLSYERKCNVTHLLWVLHNDLGIDELKKHITKDLDGLKISPFYGCHILRPDDVLGCDSKSMLENIITALNGTVVDTKSKYDCCGFHVVMIAEEIALNMTKEILTDAHDEEADVILTPCTLCHIKLDAYQPKALKNNDTKFEMPILHLAQLIGLGMQLPKKELQMNRHIVMNDKIASL